ncbi:hypothetical protein LCGC14_0390840 [marine sediment metagenome]|uniref:DUF551 domain-containing protein n=1 Tax=marine sediment metagenome TaxID=412755 RepID=A0A0F9T5L0_9ZZZZ
MSEWKKEFQYLLDRKILSRDELAYLFGQINSIIEAELKQHRWIPVSERLPEQKNSYCSAWVVARDKRTWTIAQYNYEYARWEKDHSPYDLSMEAITHWKPIILP